MVAVVAVAVVEVAVAAAMVVEAAIRLPHTEAAEASLHVVGIEVVTGAVQEDMPLTRDVQFNLSRLHSYFLILLRMINCNVIGFAFNDGKCQLGKWEGEGFFPKG